MAAPANESKALEKVLGFPERGILISSSSPLTNNLLPLKLCHNVVFSFSVFHRYFHTFSSELASSMPLSIPMALRHSPFYSSSLLYCLNPICKSWAPCLFFIPCTCKFWNCLPASVFSPACDNLYQEMYIRCLHPKLISPSGAENSGLFSFLLPLSFLCCKEKKKKRSLAKGFTNWDHKDICCGVELEWYNGHRNTERNLYFWYMKNGNPSL